MLPDVSHQVSCELSIVKFKVLLKQMFQKEEKYEIKYVYWKNTAQSVVFPET